jgi:hypothetical protein
VFSGAVKRVLFSSRQNPRTKINSVFVVESALTLTSSGNPKITLPEFVFRTPSEKHVTTQHAERWRMSACRKGTIPAGRRCPPKKEQKSTL